MVRLDEKRAASPASFFGTLIRCIVIGGFLGMLSSLMVNCSLVEVSCSPFFAAAFGLLFIVTASMMASQIINNGPHVKNRTLLIGFSLMNLFAGATSFLLERDWSHGLSMHMKVPFYALLGACLAFSVNFACLDLLARADCFSSMQLFVRTEWQVRVVAINALCTGCLYGTAFGVLDVEDEITKSPERFRSALNNEARICYPLGASSGALAAIFARLLEVRAESRDPDLRYARGADRRDNL